MVFSNTTTLAGIIQTFERLTDSGYAYVTGDTTRMKEATNLANLKGSVIYHIIHKITGNWAYDDSNQVDMPFATTNLISGQSRYALPEEALTVQRLEIKDSSGEWVKLRPLVKETIPGAIDEFQDVNSTPMYYTLVNGVITLYPATNYNSTNGLKIYYDRGAVEFETSDTVKTPGFANTYHEILPIMMAIDWYLIKQSTHPTLVKLEQRYLELKKAMEEHYSSRFKDYKPHIGRAKISFK